MSFIQVWYATVPADPAAGYHSARVIGPLYSRQEARSIPGAAISDEIACTDCLGTRDGSGLCPRCGDWQARQDEGDHERGRPEGW